MSTVIEREESYAPLDGPLGAVGSQTKNPNLTRWGWGSLDDISVQDRSATRFVGAWPNESLRARVPLPFYLNHGHTYVPNEVPATVGTTIDQVMAVRLPSWGEGEGPPPTRILLRTPLQRAFDIAKDHFKEGFTVFEHLRGEEKESFDALYYMLLPLEDKALKPILHVESGESRVRLWQIRDYVKRGGQAEANLAQFAQSQGANKSRVFASGVEMTEFEAAKMLLADIREAVTNGWEFANLTLGKSEMDIKHLAAGGRGKVEYDAKDERFLLETNRTRMKDVQSNQNEQIAGGIAKGIADLGDKLLQRRDTDEASERAAMREALVTMQRQMAEFTARTDRERDRKLAELEPSVYDTQAIEAKSAEEAETLEEIKEMSAKSGVSLSYKTETDEPPKESDF